MPRPLLLLKGDVLFISHAVDHPQGVLLTLHGREDRFLLPLPEQWMKDLVVLGITRQTIKPIRWD